jgi:hypothetical protein
MTRQRDCRIRGLRRVHISIIGRFVNHPAVTSAYGALSMQIKRMQWFKKVSAWEYSQARREHNARMAQRFRDNAAVASNSLLTAQINLSVGLATIAAQRSLDRTTAELNAAKAGLNRLA